LQISDSSSRILAGLLEARTGQQLTMSRRWRIETALSAILRERGIGTLDELITILVMGKEPGLSERVVEALLNNETYFFRDRTPFDTLSRHALPALAVQRASKKRLRIWSAGCSTGQEAYSLAMLFADHPEQWKGWTIDILGTDVSGAVIDRARDGVYTGRPGGPFTYREGKAQAIRELAEREGIDLAASYAYSDSESDLPMLRAVGHPVAVNPDKELARVAREEGWEIMRFERLGRKLRIAAAATAVSAAAAYKVTTR